MKKDAAQAYTQRSSSISQRSHRSVQCEDKCKEELLGNRIRARKKTRKRGKKKKRGGYELTRELQEFLLFEGRE